MARRDTAPVAASPITPAEPDTKSARTKTRILDAAAKVLSTKGYSGMRLADVADVADLQAPAIYYYFSSREELIEEVMWTGTARMREHLDDVLSTVPDGTSPLEKLLIAVEAHLRHELELSDYATASIRNSGQVSEKIRARQLVEEHKYGEIWHDLLKAAAKEGELRKDLDLFISQMLIFGALNWTTEWWNPKRGTVDKVVANAQAFVRNALAAQR